MNHDSTLSFFDLKHSPFGKEVNVKDLWLDPSRESAVDRLVEAVHRRQHALVRGEPGVGKNCVTRAMKHRLPETAFRVVYVANVTVGRRDFYRQLSFALGLQPRGTMAAVFEAVQREVRGSWSDHRIHPVLVIDEAHLMPDATLSHLHVLANFDMDSRPLLSLVLVGLPELQDRLRLGVHRSLLTRIGTMVDIGVTGPAADHRSHLQVPSRRHAFERSTPSGGELKQAFQPSPEHQPSGLTIGYKMAPDLCDGQEYLAAGRFTS